MKTAKKGDFFKQPISAGFPEPVAFSDARDIKYTKRTTFANIKYHKCDYFFNFYWILQHQNAFAGSSSGFEMLYKKILQKLKKVEKS